MDEKEKRDPSIDDNLNNIEDTYSIPSTSSLINEDFEEEELLELGEPQDETHKKDESSSDGAIDCDEWQDLGKSDYAKVIFCDLYYEPVSGSAGCKFEITDSVHEDPCDYIALFHIGFEKLDECLAFKPLSETRCEDDGKLLRCNFNYDDLTEVDMGFYQFLYITHDKEICGASMPFEIKPERNSPSPDDSVIAEKVDEDDFLLVSRGLEKKNEQLLKQLTESHETNRDLCIAIVTSAKDRSACDAEKMAILESFKNTIESLRSKLAMETDLINHLKENMKVVVQENNKLIEEQSQNMSMISTKEKYIKDLLGANDELVKIKNDTLRMAEVLEEQIKSIKAENDLGKTQFCEEKIKTQQLEEQKSALEKETKELKLQVAKLHTLEEKNTCLETELAHIQRSRSHINSGIEEVTDLQFMVKALEQSKKLATKEINVLSKMVLNTVDDVNTLTAKLKDCEKELEESKASEKAAMWKIESLNLKAKEDEEDVKLAFEKHVEEVQMLKAELVDCEESLKQSQNSETEAKEEILELRKELSECSRKLAHQCSMELKLQDSSKQLMDVIVRTDKEVSDLYNLIASWKPGTQSINDFRAKKCAVFSKCGALKDNLKVLIEKTQKQIDFSVECSIVGKEIEQREARVTELKTELKEKEADNQKLNEDLSNVSQKCSKLEEENSLLKTELESVGAHLQKKEDCLLKLCEDLSKESQKCSHLKEGNFFFKTELESAEAELEEKENCFQKLNEDLSNASQKCSELEEEKSLLKTELQSVEKQLQEKEDCFQKLLKEMSDLSKELSNVEDQIKEFSNKCTFYEDNLLIKESHFLQLSKEILMKDELIKSLRNEKEEEMQRLRKELADCIKELADCKESLKQFQNAKEKESISTSKEKELQELVHDHVARLSEAAKLYKKQYKEIEKLKKKLTKSKKESQLPSSLLSETTASWTSSFSDVAGTSPDTPINILTDASCYSPPAKVLVLARNSNDSDTGERVSEGSSKSAEASNKEKNPNPIPAFICPLRPNSTNERSALYKALLTKSKKQETRFDKSSVLNNENPKCVNLQRLKDGNHSEIGGLPPSNANEAPFKSGEATTSQTQKEPDSKVCRVSICPYCGMAFKKYMPKVFLAHHIAQHVPKHEKPAYEISSTASAESPLFTNGHTNEEAETQKMYSIPCTMCKEVFYVSCKTMEALAKHLKEQHDSMMCHCCGILFDKYTPSHFIADHMSTHFQLEQAEVSVTTSK